MGQAGRIAFPNLAALSLAFSPALTAETILLPASQEAGSPCKAVIALTSPERPDERPTERPPRPPRLS